MATDDEAVYSDGLRTKMNLPVTMIHNMSNDDYDHGNNNTNIDYNRAPNLMIMIMAISYILDKCRSNGQSNNYDNNSNVWSGLGQVFYIHNNTMQGKSKGKDKQINK